MPSEDVANILLSEKRKITGTTQSQFCVCVKIYIAKKKKPRNWGCVNLYFHLLFMYLK